MKRILYLLSISFFLLTSLNVSAQNPADSTDIYGCMDPDALNYDPLATIDLGFCTYYCDSTAAYFWFSGMNDSIITIQSFAYSLSEPIEYLWDFGDGMISSDASPEHLYTEAGVYTLCLTITAPNEDNTGVCSSIYCDSLYASEGAIIIVTDDIYGCTDPLAINYNPMATIGDGSCFYDNDSTGIDIFGCTDPLALNYNPLATVNDGSCFYNWEDSLIYGCTDPMALNYNPFATSDDGSCFYGNDTLDVYGCMDTMAVNYNPWATIDDGSCYYTNDSIVFGCTDSSALNYDPFATINDGSCLYYCDSTYAYFNVFDIDENNGVITITENSYSNIPIVSYLWDFGDGNTSTDQYPTHVYESDGFYMLCLTIVTDFAPMGNFYCTSTYCDTIGISLMQIVSNGFTLNVISETATSINEQTKVFKDVHVYPNPANSILNISFMTLESEDLTSTIYDLSGRVVKTWTRKTASGSNIESVGIEDLTPGLYQIELRNNTDRSILRFQVIK